MSRSEIERNFEKMYREKWKLESILESSKETIEKLDVQNKPITKKVMGYMERASELRKEKAKAVSQIEKDLDIAT